VRSALQPLAAALALATAPAHGGAVLVVAHNAGDSALVARRAIAAGADVVEIDVALASGGLRALDTHRPAGALVHTPGPTLARAWSASTAAPAIELDLKPSSWGSLAALTRFLRAHRGRPLILSSRSARSLATMRRLTPWALRLLSVGDAAGLARLRATAALRRGVDGVSLAAGLADEATVRWLGAQRLLVVVWTVNDARAAARLAELGVAAITTDSAAVTALVHGHGGRARALARLRALPR
jgi:glycerophosphoryl diester phosphodiesterase